MRHFKLTKTQMRMSRIKSLIFNLSLVRAMGWHDPLKISAVLKRLNSAYQHLTHRHHKRANVQLTMALALLKGI